MHIYCSQRYEWLKARIGAPKNKLNKHPKSKNYVYNLRTKVLSKYKKGVQRRKKRQAGSEPLAPDAFEPIVPRKRYEIRDMDPESREAFLEAVFRMKNTYVSKDK